MSQFAPLCGQGLLKYGARTTTVDYDLWTVTAGPRFSGRGRLDGDKFDLAQAFEAQRTMLTLTLQSGEDVSIFINRMSDEYVGFLATASTGSPQ